MPYITSERVAAIRQQIKKEFPSFKFSITRDHYSSVSCSILSAPINFMEGSAREERGYEQVNQFYIHDHYKDVPEIRDILQKIYDICNSGNGTLCEDGDYGTVPNFYVNINIGRWDKPFIFTGQKQLETV